MLTSYTLGVRTARATDAHTGLMGPRVPQQAQVRLHFPAGIVVVLEPAACCRPQSLRYNRDLVLSVGAEQMQRRMRLNGDAGVIHRAAVHLGGAKPRSPNYIVAPTAREIILKIKIHHVLVLPE